LDDCVLAGPAGAKRIDVISLTPHRDSELHRFDRAILADRFQEIVEFADQLERQPGRIAGPAEQGRRKRSTGFGGRKAPTRLRRTVGLRWSPSGQIRIL